MTRIRTIAFVVWLEMLRRKDAYVLLILMGAMLSLLVSLDIFGLGGLVRYVMDIGLLMAWLLAWLLAVNVGARELPQEETRRTIYPLLAKPITRFELVVGKWLGAWSIVSAATLSFYVLLIGVVAAKGGHIDIVTFMQAFLLHCAAIAVMVGMAVFFSTRLNHDAAATLSYVVTAASLVLVPRIPAFVAKAGSALEGLGLMMVYHLVPHFEIFDMRRRLVHNFGPAEWHIFCFSLLYGTALCLLFILLAWLAYRRKRFVRGRAA